MPAQSKAQQRFMGMVHSAQNGDMKNPSKEVQKAADSMSDKDAKDFASTKHDDLPDYIKEMIRQMVRETMTNSMIDEMTGSDAAGDYNTPYAFSGKDSEAKKGKKQADLTGYTVVKENRWRDIKNEEAPATTKVNKGIANINNQLAEIEKFLGWYGKLKAENGVNNGNFWKRTNNHIYTIKERLLNLERQVRKISE
jgi:transcriptional regulator of met regulon